MQRVLAVSCLVLAGCADRTTPSGTLSGRVTFRGKPLPGGAVRLWPVGGASPDPVAAHVRADGTFTALLVPAGSYRITVDTEPIKQVVRPNEILSKAPPGLRMSPIEPSAVGPTYVAIPARYADPDKSGLAIEVRRGRQQHDLELAE